MAIRQNNSKTRTKVASSKAASSSKATKSTPKKPLISAAHYEVLCIVLGVIMLLFGFFVTASVLNYYSCWKADYSIVSAIGVVDPEAEVTNPCGPFGAKISHLLVGRTFGVVGIIIPLALMLISVRMFGRKPIRALRLLTLLAMILVLTSTTLAAIFGNTGVFVGGWGGEYGTIIADMIYGVSGSVGLVTVLLAGWFLLGVFVNRNFVHVVGRVSNAAISGSGQLVQKVKSRKRKNKGEGVDDDMDDEDYDDEEYSDEDDSEGDDDSANHDVEGDDEEDLVIARENPHFDEPQTVGDTREEQVAETLAATEGDDGIVITVKANEMQLVGEDEAQFTPYNPMLDLKEYEFPHVSLLEDYKSSAAVSDEEILENKVRISETLKYFGINILNIEATVGPTITLYEIVQAQGVKISKIQGLENDIAQSLKAIGIRIIAPIPGRGTIGIEVPNRKMQVVSMYSSIRSVQFKELKAELPIVVGSTIQNESYVFDLAKMPHLLVAGATGQGKSVGLNAIITSLLYRKHPSELKFVMIDPKMVEFTPYKSLENHFMAKMESEDDVIITDPKKAVYTLNALCDEMEKRLKLLSAGAVRNIVEYNNKFKNRRLNPEKGHFYMPYIVVIIDEFADLIMMSREVEVPVMRLAQKARAVGIHLIVATQRPDVKVITGGIKANFPARIAFRVMQMIDSRTIIDQPGANQLIGRGDMLFSKDGVLTRIQCALVETDEVGRIVDHIASQDGYTGAYALPDYTPDSGGDVDMGDSSAPVRYDALFAEIARTAVATGSISTSAIQRNFEVGFNRAGRIMTQLERAGIVGRQEGAKPREIMFHDLPSLEAKLQSLGLF